MENQKQVESFIQNLEIYANRKLSFPKEIAWLLDFARHGMQQAFDDAIFHAKFVVKTQEIMKRIGPGGDGFDKLSAEFKVSLEKTTTLLKTLVKEAPEETKRNFMMRLR